MKQAEILAEANGTDPQQPGKPIWERIPLENTPFWIVGNQEKGYASHDIDTQKFYL